MYFIFIWPVRYKERRDSEQDCGKKGLGLYLENIPTNPAWNKIVARKV
jgi:hypothetical protein